MPGDEWQKLANLRLLLAYMFTRPGQKAAVHGDGARGADGMESRRESSAGISRDDPSRAAFGRLRCAARARSTSASPRSGATTHVGRLPLDRRRGQGELGPVVRAAIRRLASHRRAELHAACRASDIASAFQQAGGTSAALDRRCAMGRIRPRRRSPPSRPTRLRFTGCRTPSS